MKLITGIILGLIIGGFGISWACNHYMTPAPRPPQIRHVPRVIEPTVSKPIPCCQPPIPTCLKWVTTKECIQRGNP